MSFQRYLLGGAAAIAIVGSMTVGAYAQETSAVIRGVVTGPSGEAAANVTVVVTHVPSGTKTTVKTNNAGIFEAAGLRVGGPYTIELTSSAYQGQKVENVFTTLGEAREIDVAMKAPAAAEEIVVTGSRSTNGLKTGPRTVVTAEQIEKSPSIGNDPKDFARRNPFVTIDPSNFDSFNVASQRGRANSLTVDNVRLNDDFGLNSSGYPTLRPPISEEAIASIAVNVAPYSVEYNKFTGGNLNVVTKSGTNDFHGSAFYEYSDDQFRNDHIRHVPVTQPFTEDTWGGSLGGPIWPDRAFFFLDYQRFTAEKPFPSGPFDGAAPLRVENITQSNVTAISGLENTLLGFNYDAQHPLSANAPIQETAIDSLAKLDVNIMPGQRLVMTYQQIHNALPTDGLGSFTNRLDLASDFYTAGDRVEAFNYQLFSNWTDNFSTEVTYSHKHVKQIQDGLAGDQTATGAGDNPNFFGEVVVQFPVGGVDNSGVALPAGSKLPSATNSTSTLTIGTDTSRQANQLSNSVDFYKAKGTYTLGRHSFMGGYEREDYHARNLFLQSSEGVFTFSNTTQGGAAVSGLQNFLNGTLTSLSYTDANADYNGDGFINKNDAVALWGYTLDSFYGQDTWSITNDLSLIAGVRYDRFSQSERPTPNSFFQQRYGYANTKNLDGLDIVLPRFAFNWKPDRNTEINGGVGLFSGGGPNVWVSNVFSNDGVRTSNISCSRNTGTNAPQASSSCPLALATNVLQLAYPSNAVFDINPALDQQIQGALVNGVNALASVNNTNNISPNFQIPAQWRSNVEITHAFYLFNQPNPWVFNAGVLYGKVKAESAWRDLRGGAPIGVAPDGRPIYNGPGQRAALINSKETLPAGFAAPVIDSGNDIELFSAHSGHTVAYTVGLAKTFDNGFDFDVSYTGTQSTEAQPALSSVAFSNWSNWATADSNNPVVATSNNEVRDSYKADITWHHAFFGDNDTAITMFAEYRSGYPFSLTFQPVNFAGGVNTTSTSCANGVSGTSACNLVYFGDGGSGTRQLFYVPTGPTDPKVVYPGANGAATAAALDAFINSFQSLRDFRGHIASRNAFTNPMVFRVDMRFSQELPAFFPGGAKLIGYLDIKNVLNLVNNSWGLVKAVDFPSTAPIVDVSYDPVNQQYRYSNFRQPVYVFNSTGGGASSANRSQWQIKFGAKYKF